MLHPGRIIVRRAFTRPADPGAKGDRTEMLTVFVITAGVFFHQATKFLDNRYARNPLTVAHPFGFPWDYLTQVITMVPFFFIAQAFRPSVTHDLGYTWFFGFYVLLLGSGLILLFLAVIRLPGWFGSMCLGKRSRLTNLGEEGPLVLVGS